MASINYSQVRKGMVIVGEDGQLYAVVDRDLNTPGNWRAILNLKLKNLKPGPSRPSASAPKIRSSWLISTSAMQYLYKEGDEYVFMDKETFDQISLNAELAGEMILYLKENEDAQVTFYDGKPISLELPATVDLKIVETEPSVKGATAAAQFKPATLETGLKITVPPFIGIGEVVQVDTRTGEYLSRAVEKISNHRVTETTEKDTEEEFSKEKMRKSIIR